MIRRYYSTKTYRGGRYYTSPHPNNLQEMTDIAKFSVFVGAGSSGLYYFSTRKQQKLSNGKDIFCCISNLNDPPTWWTSPDDPESFPNAVSDAERYELIKK